MGLVLLGGVLIYWGGMILNDVFDYSVDVQQRPERPLPSGRITRTAAAAAGWGCLVVGGLVAAASGYVPDAHHAATWLPAAVAAALVVAVVLYDGPLKRTALAPLVMGSCRSLSFLLGASAVTVPAPEGWWFPKHILAIALGFGLYIMGLTSIGRREAEGGNQVQINTGTMLTIIGLLVLAFAPSIHEGPAAWMADPKRVFPLAIALVAYRVVISAIRTANDPVPAKIQATVRGGIMAIIPLAACFAVLGSGWWGVGVFLLVIPAYGLAGRFRVT